MIAQIEGKLVKLDAESCLVQVGSISYEVMLPGYCVPSSTLENPESTVLSGSPTSYWD